MSFDAIAATFLFVLIAVFGAIYAFNFFSADITGSLNAEAGALGELLIRELSGRPDGTDQVRIDERRLFNYITRMEDEGYNRTRNDLGVRSEFCVFFEDEEGQIVTLIVRDSDGGGLRARPAHFGSSRVLLNGSTVPCG